MKLVVNNREREAAAAGDTHVLRNDLGQHGPKFGCGQGLCGACTILVDGRPVRSCVFPVAAAAPSNIVTLEGLSDDVTLRGLQESFIAEQAAQCGYCAHGMILTAKFLLDRVPRPSRDEICRALDGNLCRCGTHVRILRAVERAAASLQG